MRACPGKRVSLTRTSDRAEQPGNWSQGLWTPVTGSQNPAQTPTTGRSEEGHSPPGSCRLVPRRHPTRDSGGLWGSPSQSWRGISALPIPSFACEDPHSLFSGPRTHPGTARSGAPPMDRADLRAGRRGTRRARPSPERPAVPTWKRGCVRLPRHSIAVTFTKNE